MDAVAGHAEFLLEVPGCGLEGIGVDGERRPTYNQRSAIFRRAYRLLDREADDGAAPVIGATNGASA